MEGKVKVLGSDYSIVAGDQTSLRGRYGFCDFNSKEIVYADHMEDSTVREVVLHEIIHACDLATGVESNELTEEQTQRLSAVLFSVIRDNDSIFKWICNRGEK